MSATELDALVAEIGARLVAGGWMVATAESCTGGLIAGALTEVSGSSAWFDRGLVTYTNEAKQDLLGVPAATLAAHGAVSEPVARAMAEGALARAPAKVEFALAVTGVAGPTGGTPDKPVGMVCFGWARRGTATRVATRHFAGGRAAVRGQTVRHALEGLRRLLDAPASAA